MTVIFQEETMPSPSSADQRAAPLGFTEYVSGHWAALHRFAYSVTGNGEDAKDAVQDALMACYQRWNQIATGNPDAYIRRSIVNAHIDRWRKTGREDVVDDIDSLARPVSDGAEARADADLAIRLCHKLPPQQRAAVVLRYLEDRDYDEIADICGVTQATARSLVRHALTALRAQFPVRSTDV